MTVSTAGVSVVIPALNEAQSIGFVVSEMPWDQITECIVVDNGSTDRTSEIASAAGARIVHSPRGYGAACMAGSEAASPLSDVIVYLDGDGSDVVAQMPELLRPLRNGSADFVIGSRLRGKREPGSMLASQVFAGWMVGVILKLRYGVEYTDMGPFRAIRRDALRRLRMTEKTYGWNIEMQIRAAQARLRIVEVPVDHRCRFAGTSKVAGSWRGSLKAIVCILQVLLRVGLFDRATPAV